MAKDYLMQFLPDLEEFKEKNTNTFPAALEATPSGAVISICSGCAWQADGSPKNACTSSWRAVKNMASTGSK